MRILLLFLLFLQIKRVWIDSPPPPIEDKENKHPIKTKVKCSSSDDRTNVNVLISVNGNIIVFIYINILVFVYVNDLDYVYVNVLVFVCVNVLEFFYVNGLVFFM